MTYGSESAVVIVETRGDDGASSDFCARTGSLKDFKYRPESKPLAEPSPSTEIPLAGLKRDPSDPANVLIFAAVERKKIDTSSITGDVILRAMMIMFRLGNRCYERFEHS